MMREERQAWAWIHVVLQHAAIRWQSRQHRQYPFSPTTWEDNEEMRLWPQMVTPCDYDADPTWWMRHCLARLTPRDRVILQALYAGETQIAIAHRLHCHVRTVYRAIHQIRRLCPYV
ncbi:MAG: hypothetical protein C7B43_21250 [Sulfobacillus benefaciens]|uniref:RNA polymerase sigma factor 70 region 4 type 2 domain-containing protein n=1 Tax=Sulfobacillus benefaciens TaxID=453960 RepID=A0A2T2WH07_9FIRM|nr:MAG: hypothetical protein C7B43_21250 [Sulfobacillus benefaciens]